MNGSLLIFAFIALLPSEAASTKNEVTTATRIQIKNKHPNNITIMPSTDAFRSAVNNKTKHCPVNTKNDRPVSLTYPLITGCMFLANNILSRTRTASATYNSGNRYVRINDINVTKPRSAPTTRTYSHPDVSIT